MPKYVFRIKAEVLRTPKSQGAVFRHIDVPVRASSPEDARVLLGKVLGALVEEVQKGRVLELP